MGTESHKSAVRNSSTIFLHLRWIYVVSMRFLHMQIEQEFDDGETYHIEVNHGDSGPFTHIAHYPIKSGPRTYKSINVFAIDGKDDDDPERYRITFWKAEPHNSRYLRKKDESRFNCQKEEVLRLLGFLENFYELEGLDRGEHVIIRKDSPSAKAAASAVQAIKNCESDKEDVLMSLIGSINEMDVDLNELDLSEEAVEKDAIRAEYAIKHARTRSKLDEFRSLVDECKSEQHYQEFLEDNPWLFGQEYVSRLDIRELTRGDEVDFCMESVDGFYDIIEIKTPQQNVLVQDTSHDTYRASSELSGAIAQVEDYIKAIESNEAEINLSEGIHMVKPRGVIVIGDEIAGPKRESLRILNSHLNRLNVYTFTDVLELGGRMVRRYEGNAELPTRSITDQ